MQQVYYVFVLQNTKLQMPHICGLDFIISSDGTHRIPDRIVNRNCELYIGKVFTLFG